VDALRLFEGQETEDSTTATQLHQWNPSPTRWTTPPTYTHTSRRGHKGHASPHQT